VCPAMEEMPDATPEVDDCPRLHHLPHGILLLEEDPFFDVKLIHSPLAEKVNKGVYPLCFSPPHQ